MLRLYTLLVNSNLIMSQAVSGRSRPSVRFEDDLPIQAASTGKLTR